MAELPAGDGLLYFAPQVGGDASFDLYEERATGVACVNITREQGAAIRDALSAWLDGNPETPATAGSRPAEQADGHPDPLPPVAGPGEPACPWCETDHRSGTPCPSLADDHRSGL